MKLKFFVVIFSTLAILAYLACNKKERHFSAKEQTEIEKRFFNEHSSVDSNIKNIQRLIERSNNKDNFIPNIVETVGYPYWDYTTYESFSLTQGKEVANEKTTYFLVPFVRPNEKKVNAILTLKVKGSDTSFRWQYDWQYEKYGFNNSKNNVDNAFSFFTMFANKEKAIFGTKSYIVTDGRILGYQKKQNLLVTFNDSVTSKPYTTAGKGESI